MRSTVQRVGNLVGSISLAMMQFVREPTSIMHRLVPLLFLLCPPTALGEPSAGCFAEVKPGSGEHLLTHDGLTRGYLLDHADHEGGEPPSLLLALHGYTGSPEIIGAPTTAVFVTRATASGYIVVRPASTAFMTDLNADTASAMGYIDSESEWSQFPVDQRRVEVASWNDLAASRGTGPEGPICLPDADTYPCPPECGDCGPCVWASCRDDVGFIEALMLELDERVCFDRSRRFVLGHSNGGMLAQALTCERPNLFAGGASIKGQPEIGFACGNPQSPSFIQIAGAQDTTVPHDGVPASDGFLYETSHRSALRRAGALECRPDPRQGMAQLDRPVECTLWDQCSRGKRIADCVDPQGGHEWPGNAQQGQWGANLIFRFWSGSEILQPPGGETPVSKP